MEPYPDWLRQEDGFALLVVRVVPHARRTELDGVQDGMLRVRLAAPPVEGQANRALTDYLAACCDLPRRAVKIKRGQSSRCKQVQADAPADAVWLRLSALLQRPA
ncbi:DUF167 domain-containing protein [Thiomonas intermedia]|uniref:DUF167 domain-containing protein n=1 Tax=Thiomonas intermedia TaxID=926 RepID=UPI0009A4FCED|nr:DUF167 domain-containing protein [Thiomonas intermedia]